MAVRFRTLAVSILMAMVLGEWSFGWVSGEQPVMGGEREVWWTTTDCPPEVRVPCLDPNVSLYDLPTWAYQP